MARWCVGLVLLVGCATHWTHPWKDPGAFAIDDYECFREAQQPDSVASLYIGVARMKTNKALYRRCLVARGWRD